MNSDSLKNVDKSLIFRIVVGIAIAYFLYYAFMFLWEDGVIGILTYSLPNTVLYAFSLFVVVAKWKNPQMVHAAAIVAAAAVFLALTSLGIAIVKIGYIPRKLWVSPFVGFLLVQVAIPCLLRIQLKNLGGLPKKEFSFPSTSVAAETATTPGGISERLYAVFIGGNTAYYLPTFASFAAIGGNFGFSFNLGGFVFPTAWLFYRKMYLAGIIMFLLTGFLSVTGWLLSGLIIGTCGNWLYFNHATKKLALLGGNANSEQAAAIIGGTNAVLAAIVLFLNVIVAGAAIAVLGSIMALM